jgi:alkylation response protein AidB-like acyl-CoA dehydrogenase
VALMREGLIRRGRSADPHHRARLGRAAMASETARLWVERAAARVEIDSVAPELAEAYGSMARLSVERSALEVMALAEQALGLGSMMHAEPIERVVRDLTTYIRQPFPDAVLDEVADYVLRHDAEPQPFP